MQYFVPRWDENPRGQSIPETISWPLSDLLREHSRPCCSSARMGTRHRIGLYPSRRGIWQNPCAGTPRALLNLLDRFWNPMRAVSSMMASSSKCLFSRSIKCSSIASDRSVTASAYSSATRSRSLNRALCCQTSSASTLPGGTPRFKSVAEFISTQKRQPLSWDTRTVTSDRDPGFNGEFFRSIMP